MRRTVTDPEDRGGPADTLFSTGPVGALADLVATIRGLSPVAAALLTAPLWTADPAFEEHDVIPGMGEIEAADLDEVESALPRSVVTVLLAYRGRIADAGGSPSLRRAELVIPSPTMAGHSAGDVFTAALRTLGVREDRTVDVDAGEEPPHALPGGAAHDDADDLAGDLAAARERITQDRLWDWIDSGSLTPDARRSDDASGTVAWNRRTPDGAALDIDVSQDMSDRLVLVFIGVDDTPVVRNHPTANVFTYRLGSGIDLRTASADPAVQRAFLAHARDHGYAKRREEAVRVLCRSIAGTADDADVPERAHVPGAYAALGGTVVALDYRGVRVGSRMRHHVARACSVSLDAQAADVLRARPGIVGAIAGRISGADGPPAQLGPGAAPEGDGGSESGRTPVGNGTPDTSQVAAAGARRSGLRRRAAGQFVGREKVTAWLTAELLVVVDEQRQHAERVREQAARQREDARQAEAVRQAQAAEAARARVEATQKVNAREQAAMYVTARH